MTDSANRRSRLKWHWLLAGAGIAGALAWQGGLAQEPIGWIYSHTAGDYPFDFLGDSPPPLVEPRSLADDRVRAFDELDRPRFQERTTHRASQFNEERFTVVATEGSEVARQVAEEFGRAWDEFGRLADTFTHVHRNPDFGLGQLVIVVDDQPQTARDTPQQTLQYQSGQTLVYLNVSEGELSLEEQLPRLREAAGQALLHLAELDRKLPRWAQEGLCQYAAEVLAREDRAGPSPEDAEESDAFGPVVREFRASDPDDNTAAERAFDDSPKSTSSFDVDDPLGALEALQTAAASATREATDLAALDAARREFLGPTSGKLAWAQAQLSNTAERHRDDAEARFLEVKEAIEGEFAAAQLRLAPGAKPAIPDDMVDEAPSPGDPADAGERPLPRIARPAATGVLPLAGGEYWRQQRAAPDQLAESQESTDSDAEDSGSLERVKFLLEADDAKYAPAFLLALRELAQEETDGVLASRSRLRDTQLLSPPDQTIIDDLLEDLEPQFRAWQEDPLAGQPLFVPDGTPRDPEALALQKEMAVVLKLAHRLERRADLDVIQPRVTEFRPEGQTEVQLAAHHAQAIDIDRLEQELVDGEPWATIGPDGNLLLWTDEAAVRELLGADDSRYSTQWREDRWVLVTPAHDGNQIEAWLEDNPAYPSRPLLRMAERPRP